MIWVLNIERSHMVYQIEYRFVWVTKYSYKILEGSSRTNTRTGSAVCEVFEIRIVRGVVSKDHVHI